MGSRNRPRATFEKRQREMARQERQAEKRARRQAKNEPSSSEDLPVGEESLYPTTPPAEPPAEGTG